MRLPKLLLVAVALTLSLTGCTTIGNISKMNRYLPVVENLVFLQDYAKTSGSPVSKHLCGADPGEAADLSRMARVMGWTESIEDDEPEVKGEYCVKYIYTPKSAK